VSHRVSGGAARPRRLYYTCYYTGAAVCMSRPAGDADPGSDDLPHKYLGRERAGQGQCAIPRHSPMPMRSTAQIAQTRGSVAAVLSRPRAVGWPGGCRPRRVRGCDHEGGLSRCRMACPPGERAGRATLEPWCREVGRGSSGWLIGRPGYRYRVSGWGGRRRSRAPAARPIGGWRSSSPLPSGGAGTTGTGAVRGRTRRPTSPAAAGGWDQQSRGRGWP
jgi:hypothetical protein